MPVIFRITLPVFQISFVDLQHPSVCDIASSLFVSFSDHRNNSLFAVKIFKLQSAQFLHSHPGREEEFDNHTISPVNHLRQMFLQSGFRRGGTVDGFQNPVHLPQAPCFRHPLRLSDPNMHLAQRGIFDDLIFLQI